MAGAGRPTEEEVLDNRGARITPSASLGRGSVPVFDLGSKALQARKRRFTALIEMHQCGQIWRPTCKNHPTFLYS